MNHEILIVFGIFVGLVMFYVGFRYFFFERTLPKKPLWEREYDSYLDNSYYEPLGDFHKEKEAQENLDTVANKALKRVVIRSKKPTTTRRKSPRRQK